MNRRRRRCAVTLGALALTLAPLAGTASAEDPAASTTADGQLEVYYPVSDGSLVHQRLAPGGWTAPEGLGGRLVTGPASITVGSAPGTTSVFGVGTDFAVWYRSTSGDARNIGSWGPWTRLGGTTYTAPAVSCTGGAPDQHTIVYVRGTDSALWSKDLSGGQWARRGGRLVAGPAAVPATSGVCPPEQDLLGVGTNLGIYENRGGGWVPIGGRTGRQPSLIRLPDGRTEAFVTGTNDALWTASRPSGGDNWSQWQQVGGYLTSAPAAQVLPDSTRVVVARGGNGSLYQATLTAGPLASWSWTRIPGS
jgi:hypothetical protein